MDPMLFLDLLDESLSDIELSALCRQFGVAYGRFPGGSRREKVREFLAYIQRNSRTIGLAEGITSLRPDLVPAISRIFQSNEQNIAWVGDAAVGESSAFDNDPAWRWQPTVISGQAQPGSTARKGRDEQVIKIANPYTPGRAIADSAMFFGRANELQKMKQNIFAGHHTAIIGSRHAGSSSLLFQLSKSFSGASKYVAATIDLTVPANLTPPGLYDSAWVQWWRQVKPGKVPHLRKLSDFVTAVHKLNDAGYRPLLLLDELEQLVWRPALFNDGVFETWRSLANAGLICFVITSHGPPADLMIQNGFKSRFYELFIPINPGLLDNVAAREMLVVPTKRAKLELSDFATDYFLDKAGPHPFFLQMAGYYLFDALARQEYSRGKVESFFNAAAEPFWQEMWDSMSPLGQEYYPASLMMAGKGMGGRQRRIMAGKGLAIIEDEQVKPFSSSFADWLGRLRAAVGVVTAAHTAESAGG